MRKQNDFLSEQLEQEYQSNITDLRNIKRAILKVSIAQIVPKHSKFAKIRLNIGPDLRPKSFSEKFKFLYLGYFLKLQTRLAIVEIQFEKSIDVITLIHIKALISTIYNI